ncbi:uncharacterized protein [Palaemon carinicauda]|uniref:uncharacterized protein n=1 Tax=Palaemon carinicauda TaxID=392227 RepID=UPI0035B5DE6F
MKDLLGILIRFREGKVEIAAVIEAMHHQVFVNPTDKDVLQFLWWPQGGLDRKKPQHYCMTVHIFGDVWSPARTIFELKGHLKETGMMQQKKQFLTSSLMTCFTQADEIAIKLAHGLQMILKGDGFRPTKWMSNARYVISIPLQREM